MAPLRVLMVGPSLEARGGIARLQRHYMRSQFGGAAVVVHLPTVGDDPKAVKALASARSVVQAIAYAARGDFDLVHIHLSWGVSFYRKALIAHACRLLGRPVVVHVNGSRFAEFFDESPRVVRRAITSMLERADRVVAVSPAWGETLRRTAPRAHIEVIPNAVVVPPHAADVAASRRLVFLGRLGERKGTPELLRALARVDDVELEAVLAGDGAVAEASALVRDLGLDDRVEVRGWVPEGRTGELLSTAAAFVLPTHAEGLPLSMLEAMAHGVPPLTTPVGGIPEVVVDGVNGLLVPPGDVDALARGIRRLMSDPRLRARLGAGARECVQRDYDLEVNIARMVRMFRDVRDR